MESLRTPCSVILLVTCLVVSPVSTASCAVDKPAPNQADIHYGPHPHQLLDVYLPPNDTGPFPVVIWFGGLWAPSKGVPPVDKFFPAHCAAVSVEMRVLGDGVNEKIAPPISACLLDARRASSSYGCTPRNGTSTRSGLPWREVPREAFRRFISLAQGNSLIAVPPIPSRVSTKVTCAGAHRSQPSIDPQRMQQWVPGVEWGVPAWGCSFAESLRRRKELLPTISQWTPEALLNKDAPPIYFEYNWGLAKPEGVEKMDYLVHSPCWGMGFQKLAHERGATCYVKFPDHPSEKYADIWDFLVQQLGSDSKR